MKVAVVGHVEWVEFLRVDHVPRAGEIVEGTSSVAVAAGGGAVAAVQLVRMGAETHFFTALGDDELGHRAAADLRARGVTLHAEFQATPQRRALTLVDAQRERTIILSGARHVAHGLAPLPWDVLATCAAVYVTGGDTAALRAVRACPVLVSTARILEPLQAAGIAIDALVGSDDDPREAYTRGMLAPEPALVVRTQGARGGRYILADGSEHRYAAVPTEITGDTYGAGDTFAAALAFALGERRTPANATAFAAARAADVLAFVGPYPVTSACTP